MAEVTGPISTLPGTAHDTPDSAKCDNHPEVAAYIRVQGETDSFGSEMSDLCEACYVEYKAETAKYAAERATGKCDWCGNNVTDLKQMRDWEEGSYGPIYDVCGVCRKRRKEEDEREFEVSYDPYNWVDG
jgi:hypothetical protein